jgi:hypothetical protein
MHERIKATDLRWLRGGRVKYGAAIRVLDISAGGVLLETEKALKPNSPVVLELTGADSPILLPSQVVRCRAMLSGDTLSYEGACAFRRPLTIPGVTVSLVAPSDAMSFSRPAEPTTGWQKVVARFTDGRVVYGYTNDFHPSKAHLHLSPNPRRAASTFIPLSQLKALFFVRDFVGDPTFVDAQVFRQPSHGRQLEVTFYDGEVMVGSTLSFRSEGQGFFLRPADPRSNNLRVFVTAAGMQQVRFLSTEL